MQPQWPSMRNTGWASTVFQRPQLQASCQPNGPAFLFLPRLFLVLTKSLCPLRAAPNRHSRPHHSLGVMKTWVPSSSLLPFSQRNGARLGSDLPKVPPSLHLNPGLFPIPPCLLPCRPRKLFPGSPLVGHPAKSLARGLALVAYCLCQDGAVLVTLGLQAALGLLGLPQLGGQVLRAEGSTGVCLAKHRGFSRVLMKPKLLPSCGQESKGQPHEGLFTPCLPRAAPWSLAAASAAPGLSL